MERDDAIILAHVLDGEAHQMVENENSWVVLFQKEKGLVVLDQRNVSEYKNRKDFLNGEPEVNFVDFI
jgi:hypothetical protein